LQSINIYIHFFRFDQDTKVGIYLQSEHCNLQELLLFDREVFGSPGALRSQNFNQIRLILVCIETQDAYYDDPICNIYHIKQFTTDEFWSPERQNKSTLTSNPQISKLLKLLHKGIF
jgi:hypothetical protein